VRGDNAADHAFVAIKYRGAAVGADAPLAGNLNLLSLLVVRALINDPTRQAGR
jgi:hypothetical protein